MMHDDWPELATDITLALRALRADAPEVAGAVSALARAAMERPVLPPKIKELIALGIAVATQCDPCIALHAEAAMLRGATRAEVLETIAVAIYMGAGRAFMSAAKGWEAFRQFQAREQGVEDQGGKAE
jgi:AhpD family alkylhydroperoxidase